MPLIIPSNSISGEFAVDNSARFDDGSSDYLNKTFGSAGSTTKATTSFWIKRSGLTVARGILNWAKGANVDLIRLEASDELRILFNSAVSGSINTSRLFRDVSAWYHVVFAIDTTQSTDSDRVKIYVNGVQETSFSSVTYPPLNYVLGINSATLCELGRYSTGYYDGYLAEFVHIDGQQLDPTSFGEFDEDSGIWKPIDVSGLTFGTNGFYLDFENSGSLGADVSGNGNNFTVNNLTSIDQTTDTPTNNYCTWNPLHRGTTSLSNVAFKNGNTTVDNNEAGSSIYPVMFSTFAITQGKYYMEVKVDSFTFESITIGIEEGRSDTQYGGKLSSGIVYKVNGDYRKNDTNNTYGNTYTAGDIIGIALDLDNNYLYFSKNGTWQNSGDPTSGATGTGGIAVDAISTTQTGVYHFSVSDNSSGGLFEISANFGNPSFTISSSNSDANGYGNFEYAVPSGYYALNSKNLAEYG